ncbi:MAG: cbb3-type cytochrome c oxidase subunit 3 [Bdellovibrionota bacterium]
MKAQVLANFSMPWLTCIGLLIFFAVFCGALAWVFRKSGEPVYAKLSVLPLEEDRK